MRVIYKYPMPARLKKFQLQLPVGFKFSRVAFQGDSLFLWAEVKKDSAKSVYNFEIFGTGQDIPENGTFLQTWDDGGFVFHLYQM